MYYGPYVTASMYRRAIPVWVKAAVLERGGVSEPNTELTTAYCDYCLEEAVVEWTYVDGTHKIKLEKGFHWDHVIPVAKGGSNQPDNIAVACAKCNMAKGDKLDWISPIEQWYIDHRGYVREPKV